MPFKKNLLQKIKIDRLAQILKNSIDPPAGERKTDLQSAKTLLKMGPYRYQQERDMDLYVHEDPQVREKIVVLANDLAIYNTTPEDVGLRRSPTLKEMVKIKNAIKILRDSDVLVSKRETSVETIKNACIGQLDLTFKPEDLDDIVSDGAAALDRGVEDAVIETLGLFAELLGYFPAPDAFHMNQVEMFGKLEKEANGLLVFGPLVLYHTVHNTLKLVNGRIRDDEKDRLKALYLISEGKEKADAEGRAVFEFLKQQVVENKETVSEKGYVLKA